MKIIRLLLTAMVLGLYGCEGGGGGDGDPDSLEGQWGGLVFGETMTMELSLPTYDSTVGSASYVDGTYSVTGSRDGNDISFKFSQTSRSARRAAGTVMTFDAALSGNTLSGILRTSADETDFVTFTHQSSGTSGGGGGGSSNDDNGTTTLPPPVVTSGDPGESPDDTSTTSWTITMGGTSFDVEINDDTGSISGQLTISGTPYSVSGSLSGSSMTMTITDTPVGDFVFTGALDSATSASGSTTVGGSGGENWTATQS